MIWFSIIMETIIWTVVLDIEAGAIIRRRAQRAALSALEERGS